MSRCPYCHQEWDDGQHFRCAPEVRPMKQHLVTVDTFTTGYHGKPDVCEDPECPRPHNLLPNDEMHHYGCECPQCQLLAWRMKHE